MCSRMLLWWLALVATGALASQRGAYPVEVFDPQVMEGAAFSTDVVQQADGRLLVANMRGLFRYDGSRWQLHLHPKAMGGMEHLGPAADGRIYSSFNGDVGYWQDDARGELVWHSVLDRLPTDCRDVVAETVSVLAVPRGAMFAASGRLAFVPTDPTAQPVCRAVEHVTRVVHAGDDVLMVHGLPPCLSRLDAEYRPQPVANDLDGVGLIASVPHQDGALLLNNNGQIVRYRQGRLTPWSSALHERFGQLETRPFRGLAALPDGGVAVAGMLDGVFRLDAEGRLSDVLDERAGVPTQRFTVGLFVDRHHDLWLAQERSITRVGLAQGLSVFDERHGIPSAAQLARWRGDLVVAARSGLLRMRETPQGGAFDAPVPGLLGLVGVAALDDDVLLATNGALHAVRREGDRWRSERVPVPWGQVWALEPSRFHPRRVYAGLSKGLLQIDLDDDGSLRLTPLDGVDLPVVRIAEHDADTLWAAGRVSGVLRVALGGGVPPRAYGANEGLPEGTVRPYAGPRRAWFTTLAGLRVYDPDSDRFVVPPGLPPELSSDRLYSAYEDHEGNLWVRGGAILNDVFWREGESWRIDRDLLHGVDPFPTIYGFMREGDLVWAPRANGLLRIDLSQRLPTPPAPPPLLTRVLDSRARGPLALDGLASLAPTVRDLRVDFALPFLRRGGGTAYRSRLAGFEDWSEWVASGQQHRIYTNLPDGRFSFEVEARDALQREWRMPPQTIEVRPPWQRSTPARVGYALAALAILWLAMRLGARRRQRQMLIRQRELEDLVAMRTTELRESNRQLADQAERLQSIDRLKTRFFVNVGHEFRTPLTLVLGPLDDLLRDARERLSERVRGQLQLAHRNARRVLDLIVEVLDVNRLEQGQWTLARGAHDLAALLARVAHDSEPLVERFGQSLRLDLGGFARAVADVDPAQIERALSNLIGNAAKYSPRGTAIDLRLARDGERWRVSVQDQGRGIAADALPHVFDRFFQAEGGDRASGYGIGLSLVREIALAHGGDALADSAPGVGSTFTLLLPVSDAVPADTKPRDEAPRAPMVPAPAPDEGEGDRATAGTQRVLVVDDHDDLRQRVRELLGRRFEVIEAADGESAWRMARDELPDLVVSDVMMPGCDGVELTRRLRGHPDTQAIGLLLLTAKVGSEHAVAGLRAGANDYLAKPFDASELLARCEAIVAHAQRLRHRMAAAAPQVEPEPVETGDTRWRQRLDGHIASRLHEPEFDVETLAGCMHVDRSQLFRKCKELLGMSPSDYLREARLAQGHGLLARGAGSVSEVAYACGFESLSSFTRAFKARYGLPPSQVRARAAPPA